MVVCYIREDLIYVRLFYLFGCWSNGRMLYRRDVICEVLLSLCILTYDKAGYWSKVELLVGRSMWNKIWPRLWNIVMHSYVA